jgi:hypothetical protein
VLIERGDIFLAHGEEHSHCTAGIGQDRRDFLKEGDAELPVIGMDAEELLELVEDQQSRDRHADPIHLRRPVPKEFRQ